MSVHGQQRDHAILQIGMFTAQVEAAKYGEAREGVAHPTWEELGEMGQDAYLAEATTTVDAMIALGWEPKR